MPLPPDGPASQSPPNDPPRPAARHRPQSHPPSPYPHPDPQARPQGPGGPPLRPTAVGIAEPPGPPPPPVTADPRWAALSWLLVPAVVLGAVCGGMLLAFPTTAVLPALVEQLHENAGTARDIISVAELPLQVAPVLTALLLFVARGRLAPFGLLLGAGLLGVVGLLGDVDSLSGFRLHRILDTVGVAGVLAAALGTTGLAAGAPRRVAAAGWVAGIGVGVGIGLSQLDEIGNGGMAAVTGVLRGFQPLIWITVGLALVAAVAALVAAPRLSRDVARPPWRPAVLLVALVGLVAGTLIVRFGVNRAEAPDEWMTYLIVVPGLGVLGILAALVAVGGRVPAGRPAVLAAGLAASTGLGVTALLAHTGFQPDLSAATGMPSTDVTLWALLGAAAVGMLLCLPLGSRPLTACAIGVGLQFVGLILVLTNFNQSGSRALLIAGAAVLVTSTTLLVAPWLWSLPGGLAAGAGGLMLLGWFTIARLPVLVSGRELALAAPSPDAVADPAMMLRVALDAQRLGLFVLAGCFVVGASVWCWFAVRAAGRTQQ